MQLRSILMAVAATALVAAPALAENRHYPQGGLINTIYTPTADLGCTTFDPNDPAPVPSPVTGQPVHPTTLCPMGAPDWLAPVTFFNIEDNGGGGAIPTITLGRQQSQLFNAFECESTSNFDGLGAVPGCTVEITTDTLFSISSGDTNANSITLVNNPADVGTYPELADLLPGDYYRVIWPDLPNDNLLDQGLGQFCTATCDDAVSIANSGVACTGPEVARMETGYCEAVLDLTQNAWDEETDSIVVINPIQTGPWYFTTNMASFFVPGPYRYFELDPIPNLVYGLYTNGFGTSTGNAVPLAPLGALALGGSLAYMGIASLRRKK